MNFKIALLAFLIWTIASFIYLALHHIWVQRGRKAEYAFPITRGSYKGYYLHPDYQFDFRRWKTGKLMKMYDNCLICPVDNSFPPIRVKVHRRALGKKEKGYIILDEIPIMAKLNTRTGEYEENIYNLISKEPKNYKFDNVNICQILIDNVN